MSQEMSKPKDIINTTYHIVVLSGLSVGYSMIGKKIIKIDVGDPSRDYKTIFKLVIPVSLSVVTTDWLVTQGFLPNDIINNRSKITIYNCMAITGASIISKAAFTIGGAIYDQFRNSDTERHNKAM